VDLADQRTHMIARSRAFVVPVCLDATTQAGRTFQSRFSGCSGRPCREARHRRFVERLSAYCRRSGRPPAPCPVPRRQSGSRCAASRRSQPVLLRALRRRRSAGVLPRQSVLDPHTREPETAARAARAHRLQPAAALDRGAAFVNLSADREQDTSPTAHGGAAHSLAEINELQSPLAPRRSRQGPGQ